MTTINMREVDGEFVMDDLNPYSEYVHKPEQKETKSQTVVTQVQVVKTPREVAMQNFNDVLEGFDIMTNIMEEALKRFKKLGV